MNVGRPSTMSAIASLLGIVGCASAARARSEESVPVVTEVASAAFAGAIDSARAALRGIAAAGAGVGVAVYRGNEPVWVEGLGYADRSARTPVAPERTLFRIYSVAKPMTAAAGVRLMERRKLDPSAPVQTYVPSFPDKGAAITAMQLGMHTSGIRHYSGPAEANSARHCATLQDALEIFESDPLVHAPGAAETYSSWGYVLLSAVISGAAGAPYVDAMERLVFEPAEMTAMTIDDPRSAVPNRAAYYEESGGRLRPAQGVDNTCKWGAGAFLATAADVARFGAALGGGELVSPRGMQLFLKGGDTYLAQGVGVGGTAFLLVDTSRELSIALLTNVSGDTVGPALQGSLDLLHSVFGEDPK